MAKRNAPEDLRRPLLVYVSVVATLGVLLGVLQARYEARRRPPSAEVVVRQLTESFIGEGTVRSVSLQGGVAELEVAMDGVRALPQDRSQWPQFFRDATDVAADRLLTPPPQITSPALRSLERVTIRYTLQGQEVARGSKRRGQTATTVTMARP
ncbi:MAG: hypothetical protein C4303_07935 [candidate division GAL15 bacterium]